MKLIVLDRDGVINVDSGQYIKSPEEWKPIPGALEAIARLNQWGWRVVVATNQSGIGRGLFGMDTLNAINDRMVKSLAQAGGRLDGIFFCPHAADSTCDCRKPKPGMLLQIAERYNVELADVPCVGDGLRDLRPLPRPVRSLIWCSPARARPRRRAASCRPARWSIPTSTPWSPR